MEEAFGEHGENEVALWAGFGGEEGVEAEAADGTEYRLDVTVRAGVQDAEGGDSGKEFLAGEGTADQVDEVGG